MCLLISRPRLARPLSLPIMAPNLNGSAPKRARKSMSSRRRFFLNVRKMSSRTFTPERTLKARMNEPAPSAPETLFWL